MEKVLFKNILIGHMVLDILIKQPTVDSYRMHIKAVNLQKWRCKIVNVINTSLLYQ